MVKKEELFSLIKSLSRSEKRYFKLYSTHNKANANYVRLFDAIDKQAEYNEHAIKKLFQGESFIKQFHVIKNYLRNLILDALRSFHRDLSKDSELKESLRNVEILFNKELYELCSTELKKAERIATDYELLTGRVEVLSWKRKLKQAQSPHDYEAFEQVVHEQKKQIEKLNSNNEYWSEMIHQTWQTLSRSNAPDTNEVNLSSPQTLEATILKYNTDYIKAIRVGESEVGEKALKELLSSLEKHPLRLKNEPAAYVSTINNLTSYMVFSKREDEALELIQKAKDVYQQLRITTEKRSLLKQILRTYNLELEIYRNNCSERTDLGFIESTSKFIADNKNKIPKDYLITFWFQLASINFQHKRFDECINWLNNILNSKQYTESPDLQKHARLLNIMVHFEEQNMFVLRYFIDSTKRFLKKYATIEAHDKVLLKLFANIASKPEYEHRAYFKEAYNILFDNGEAMISESILDYVDYKSWLEEKIKRKNIY